MMTSPLSKQIVDPAKKVSWKVSLFEKTVQRVEEYQKEYTEKWGKIDRSLLIDRLLNFAMDEDWEFSGCKPRRGRKPQKANNPEAGPF